MSNRLIGPVLFGAALQGAFFVGMYYDAPVRPAPAGPQYGMTAEQTAARVAQLRAMDKPYKPDTPQAGERGFGQPIIIVQGGAAGGAGVSGPVAVTPVYRCHYWSFANPQGETFESQYPCQTPREHYRTFPNGSGWNW